jgi:hypothetical protein
MAVLPFRLNARIVVACIVLNSLMVAPSFPKSRQTGTILQTGSPDDEEDFDMHK